jgi:hypothetical protein
LTRQFSGPGRETQNTTTESQKDDSSFEEMKERGQMDIEVNKMEGVYFSLIFSIPSEFLGNLRKRWEMRGHPYRKKNMDPRDPHALFN